MAITTTDWVLSDLNLTGKVVQGQPSAAGLRSWESYDQLRQEVEAAIQIYLKWGVEAVAGQVDYYSGNGEQNLVLRRPFVSAVNSVKIDAFGAFGKGPNAFGAGTTLTNGSDYVLNYDGDVGGSGIGKSGLLVCLRSSVLWMPSDFVYNVYQGGGLSYREPPAWAIGKGNLKVDYDFGFAAADMPLDIKAAVSTCVSIFANTMKYGGMLNNESLARYSYSLALNKDNQFGTVRQLLSRYRDTSA